MAMVSSVSVQVSDRVATVALNRPEARNAFDAAMIREVTEAFTALSARNDIAAIVLRGEGKSFCSGADLGYMKSMAGFSLAENQRDADALFSMFWAVRQSPVPVVARLHGHVMGGGLGLAAASDIACAVEGAQFCFSEVKLGLAPAVISSFVLERMIPSHARRYMLTGELFGVSEALASGLVQNVGREAEVDASVVSIVTALLRAGPEAVRATKAMLASVQGESDWTKKRALTARVIAERRVSAEGQEGLKAFFEKRAPSWSQSKGN
jgi:methylglutaconyl-CoA hydratase